MYDDYALIESSFLEQYGIRLRTSDLSWSEFCTYLSCINEKTALGKVVAIRAEKDPDIIKHMTPSQKQLRREWEEKQSKKYSETELKDIMLKMAEGFRKAYM